jgi:hypothetical protein
MADEKATYESSADAEAAARDAWASLDAEGVTFDEPVASEQQDEVDEGSTPESGESDAAEDESAEESEYEEAPDEESPEESNQDEQQDESASTESKTFWDQYKDDNARKNAFNETKEYAAKMSKLAKEREQRIKDLEAKLSTPASPSVPEKREPAPNPAQRLETTYKTLYETDSRVQNQVAGLGELKNQIDAGQQHLGAIDKELSDLTSGISEKNAQLKYLKRKLDADPDDLSVKADRDELISEIMADRARHNELRIERQEVSFAVNGQIQGYNNNIVQLRDYVRAHQEREEAQAVEAQELESLTEEIHKKWADASGRWFTENNIPEDEIDEVNALMARIAAAESDDIDENHLYEWMRDHGGKLILAQRKRAEEKAIKQYATQKRKDASQPAPKGTIKKPKEGSKPQTIDDLIADSARLLGNELQRAGGLR